MSFRTKVIVFAILVIVSATFLILNGKWPLDKVGDIYTGINMPEDYTTPQPELQIPDEVNFLTYETPQEIPSINFYTADGQVHNFSDWQGQRLVINLWATWCAPCVEELPLLADLKNQLHARGANYDVIAISIDRQKDFRQISRFLNRIGADALVPFMDTDSEVIAKMNISSFPVTYILNEDGMEITRYEGPLEWNNEKVIEALLRL